MEQELHASKKAEFKQKFKDSFANDRKYGRSSCLYFLGMVGSAVYFISTASSFGAGVLGIGKALVWPAIMAYKVLLQLGA